jgi:hypothetical protein
MSESRREPEESLLDHQAGAMAEEEPFDELRRDAEALGVRLSLTLPLPEPGERYHADWLDEEGRRAPALDTDVFYCGDPVELIARCLDAAVSQKTRIVVLDEDLETVATIVPMSFQAG